MMGQSKDESRGYGRHGSRRTFGEFQQPECGQSSRDQEQAKQDFFVDTGSDAGHGMRNRWSARQKSAGRRCRRQQPRISLHRLQTDEQQMMKLSSCNQHGGQNEAFGQHADLSFQADPPGMPPNDVPDQQNSGHQHRQQPGLRESGAGQQRPQPEISAVSQMIGILLRHQQNSAFVNDHPRQQKRQAAQRPPSVLPVVI